MAKAKVKSRSARKSAKRPRVPRNLRGTLDKAALAHAMLLADPCSAPLAHPVYPGTDSGYLIRVESFATLGNGPTDTAHIVHWTPGYPNGSGTQLLSAGGASSGATGVVASFGSLSPGIQFLGGPSVVAARCVAACLQVSFPGTELNRSGRIHYGLTNGGTIDLTDSVTADGVAGTLAHFARTPADMVEIYWKPSVDDTNFCDPAALGSAVIKDKRTSITVAAAGLPAGSGLTYKFTAVYEWQPKVAQGIAANELDVPKSRNTLDEVVSHLVSKGFRFVKDASTAVGAGFASGVMGAMYGRMNPSPRIRSSVF